MLSERAQQIPPFLVMEILEKAKSLERDGVDIIHLEIGEPDFPTPLKIRQAAIEALSQGKTHYTHSLGILPLRVAIADHYRKKIQCCCITGANYRNTGNLAGAFTRSQCLAQSGR